VHWLANLCARYQGLTLSQFVESALGAALEPKNVVIANEARTVERSYSDGPSPEPALWQDALWSEDEATRQFNVGLVAPELLDGSEDYDLFTESQRKVWSSISSAVAKEGKKLTLKNFRQHYAILKGSK
jgi:hypothetical protein